MSTKPISTSTEVVKPISLTKEISTLNNRKVQLISGLSATALVGGTIAATLLGGPIAAIAGLAAAALFALVALIKSFVSQPKVTSVETQPKQEFQEPVKTTAPAAATEVVATMPAPKADRFQGVKNAFASGVNFAKAHPYKTAIGAVAGTVALTGLAYGAAAAYTAYTAPTFLGALVPAGAATSTAASSNLSLGLAAPIAGSVVFGPAMNTNSTTPIVPQAFIQSSTPIFIPSRPVVKPTPIFIPTGTAPVQTPTVSNALVTNNPATTIQNRITEFAGNAKTTVVNLFAKGSDYMAPMTTSAKDRAIALFNKGDELLLKGDKVVADNVALLAEKHPLFSRAAEVAAENRTATIATGATVVGGLGLVGLYKGGKALVNRLMPAKAAAKPAAKPAHPPAIIPGGARKGKGGGGKNRKINKGHGRR